ncbi:hypothetical protein [Streptococcus cuniculi]|uniref:Immunity protein 30 domain-containing protein n=1 Tax=Streptococcus cuniculi TaxID=1432788 RepID=A0A4Y9JAI4_9STRE|nr:hypothetical protein [Streptococcus cuniculi]MBF0778962.1 hypothetical protein [Streptococcus cuniculi]TFU97116.1 hypothetical protein E4T82_09550 [Streptococcus cuniculi]
MNYYKELDKILSHPYLGDTFYDVDVEYIMDTLLPSLNQDEWKKLYDGCKIKKPSYKFKLAYCLDGYDDLNAFLLLMNLIFCTDEEVLEQVLISLISFDSSKYRYLLYQFPRGIDFLKKLSDYEKNKTIGRLSINVLEKFKL